MGTLRTTVLTTEREMAGLETAWCDLFDHSAEVTPFQSWAWLYSWWQHYGEDRRLYLVAVWDGNCLAGLLPLLLERHGGLGRLVFIGTGISDHLDIVVRRGFRDAVVETVVDVLYGDRSWHVMDLQELRPKAVAWGLARRWPGPRLTTWQEDLPIIDARSPDQILSELSRNHRSTLRRTLRRAQNEGVERVLVAPAEAEEAGRRLVKLHREMWEGRSIGPEHLTTRFEAHLGVAASRLSALGLGAVSEFRRGGQVILSSLLMFGGDFVGTYLQGAGRSAVSEYQISSLYIWDALNRATERSIPGVSLLRGLEPYKLRWKPRVVSNRRIVLGRNWFIWAPYAGYRLLHARAKRFVVSGQAPRWVVRLADGYRTLASAYRKRKRGTAFKRACRNGQELS